MYDDLKNIILEFDSKKKEIENMLINNLFKYAKIGELYTFDTSINYICYDIISNFTGKGIGDYILKYHNDKIKEIVNECYEKIKDLNELNFVDSFISFTKSLFYTTFIMSKIFLSVSNNFLKKIAYEKYKYKHNEVSQFSMDIYKEYFFDKLQNKLFNILNEFLIKEERRGKLKYREKIMYIVKIITDMDKSSPKLVSVTDTSFNWEEELDIYNKPKSPLINQEKWYNSYKDATIKYVKEKAENDKKKYQIGEYIKIELKYINEEIERQNCYINVIYHEKLKNILFKYLIKDLYNNNKIDIYSMIKEKRVFEIKVLFQLIKTHQKELNILEDYFYKYLQKQFSVLYYFQEEIIQALIDLKKELVEFISLCFNNHNDFHKILNDRFIYLFLNNKYIKYLSKYVDYCMKEKFNDKSEIEIEEIMNDILFIFKYIDSKIEFRIDFEKNLKQRIINNSFLSIQLEKEFLFKLEKEMGTDYVKKMIEMLNDLENSNKELAYYKTNSINKGNPLGISFNIKILPLGKWQLDELCNIKITIPKFLQFCIDDFENYYKIKHNSTSRKLIWFLGLSEINIQYLYLKNKNISISTLPQLLLLLCLEKYNKLNIKKISELLNYEQKLIVKEINRLIFNSNFNPNSELNKGIILANINPTTKEFKPTTEISINKNFNTTKNIFNTLPLDDKTYSSLIIKEKEEYENDIIKREKNCIIQALIARIMKSRIGQKITHLWLMNETMKENYLFKAEIELINECLEKLIEKNVIKRNENLYEFIV